MADKIKVTNPNNFRVGLKLMDGVREVVVHPKSFVLLPDDEIYYINNMCTLFQKRTLIIQDDEVNQNLGLLVKDDVASLSDEEIKEILTGNYMSMQKKLGDIKEKFIIDRIISIASGIEDLATGKVKFLSKISGYDVDQILSKDEE